MLVPAMSTEPVSTVSVPSGFSRTVALVGWMSGHPAADRQAGAAQTVAVLAAARPPRVAVFQSGCSASACQALARRR